MSKTNKREKSESRKSKIIKEQLQGKSKFKNFKEFLDAEIAEKESELNFKIKGLK